MLSYARGDDLSVTVHLNPPFPVHRGFHDSPSVRARVPSVRYFFNGFLLFDSPLGLIHRSSFPFTSQQSKGYYQDISNVDAVTHTLQLRVGQPRFHGQSGRGYKVLEWILRWHAYILVHFPRYQWQSGCMLGEGASHYPCILLTVSNSSDHIAYLRGYFIFSLHFFLYSFHRPSSMRSSSCTPNPDTVSSRSRHCANLNQNGWLWIAFLIGNVPWNVDFPYSFCMHICSISVNFLFWNTGAYTNL